MVLGIMLKPIGGCMEGGGGVKQHTGCLCRLGQCCCCFCSRTASTGTRHHPPASTLK